MKRILTENGYYADGNYYFYVKNHLGSNVITANKNGSIVQSTHYYPFGLTMAINTGHGVQPYKYTGKELDMQHGLNLYDFSARTYDPAIGRFTTVDPLAEKYYPVSPYAYCANNPVRNIDLRGDSVTILNGGEHSAMLIQNDAGKWQYYSMNGDWVYNNTGGWLGGKSYHDIGEKTFDSLQAFLESAYNTTGSKEQVANNEVSNYGFKEAYILPTTPDQDKQIVQAFKQNMSEGYNLLTNQCAQVVQKSLNAAGINTLQDIFHFYDGMTSTGVFTKEPPYSPASTFNTIRHNNPNGKYIKRKK